MSNFEIACIAIVATLATARLTRLIVFDTWPVSIWIRVKWHDLVGDSAWAKLVDCHYCAAPYFAAAILAWGYFTNWQLAWWFFTSWLALSYAASIVVSYDGDD